MKRKRLYVKEYVIFSKRLPWIVRMRDIVLTALIWAMYFYFMKDFGYFVHDAAIWIANGYGDPTRYPGLKILPDIQAFLEIVAVLVVVLIGWSKYNLIRYGKKNRRRVTQPVTVEQTAADYGVDPQDLKSWQKTQVMTMHLDGAGRVTDVVKN